MCRIVWCGLALPLRYLCARVAKRPDEDFWIIYYNFGSGFVSPKIAVYYKKLLKFRAVAIILNKNTLRFARYKNIQKSGYTIYFLVLITNAVYAAFI